MSVVSWLLGEIGSLVAFNKSVGEKDQSSGSWLSAETCYTVL